MLSGTVKFFDNRQGELFGFIAGDDGEDCHFHFDRGREIKPSGFEPAFTQWPVTREPVKGDRLVFEPKQTARGWTAESWGYADEYDSAKVSCTPVYEAHLLDRHPFLLEALKLAKRHDDDGGFHANEDELTGAVLDSTGFDRFSVGQRTKYCAVIAQRGGGQQVILLKSESWWPDGMDEGITPADPNGRQLDKLGIGIDEIVAIIKVETPLEVWWGSRDSPAIRPRPIRRTATIYLMSGRSA